MAPNKFEELKAFHQQWNGGAPITDEAEKHRFTQAFAESLQKTDPRWGRKSRANNEGPLSKDTLGYWLGPEPLPMFPTDGQLDARDIIMSSGATYWGETPPEAYNNIFARWYPVSAAPEPPTPPVDDHKDIWIALAVIRNDLNALESAVKLIGAEVADQARRISALEQAPAPTIPPFSYTVRTSSARLALTHNHEVTVTYPPPNS